ncbi:Unknown protein, partial [Striga hermonthica]
ITHASTPSSVPAVPSKPRRCPAARQALRCSSTRSTCASCLSVMRSYVRQCSCESRSLPAGTAATSRTQQVPSRHWPCTAACQQPSQRAHVASGTSQRPGPTQQRQPAPATPAAPSPRPACASDRVG